MLFNHPMHQGNISIDLSSYPEAMSHEEDSTWREYNVHSSGADDEEEQPIDLFASNNSDDVYETIQYDIDAETNIKIRSETDYDKSTGMSVWKGSEVMCTYLRQHPDVIHNKRVLELGAGCGLCGLVCRMVLNPKSVLITDGDNQVLTNLRYNAELNGLSLADSSSTTTDDGRPMISCPQLIWGKNHAIKFTERYGKQDVIIATDCVYIPQSVPPLCETISELLDHKSGLFLFVNTCASATPMDEVLRIAHDFGFLCGSDEDLWYYDDDREEKKHPVRVFRKVERPN